MKPAAETAQLYACALAGDVAAVIEWDREKPVSRQATPAPAQERSAAVRSSRAQVPVASVRADRYALATCAPADPDRDACGRSSLWLTLVRALFRSFQIPVSRRGAGVASANKREGT